MKINVVLALEHLALAVIFLLIWKGNHAPVMTSAGGAIVGIAMLGFAAQYVLARRQSRKFAEANYRRAARARVAQR